MNDQDSIDKIQQWFFSQQIKVPVDWIAACLDWLQQENQVHGKSFVELQKLVYEQWLLTDLEELGVSTVPDGVFGDKFTLNGIYCLQLNSVIDISQPCYGQLLHLQKQDTSNTTVSAETQATQKPWEEKPSRMLMMKLTDGVVEVSGMEYRNIPFLNHNLAPGTKIRVRGPVLCRRGVLMLAQNNIQLLGGEVDDLLANNNREAVLCRCLGLPPPQSSNSAAAPGIPDNNAELNLPDELISQLTDDAFEPGQESGYATNRASNQASFDVTRNTIPNQSNDSDAGFVDTTNDISDLDMLEEMERMESNHTPSAPSTVASSTISSSENVPDFNSYSTNQRSCSDVVDLTNVFETSTSSCIQRTISKQMSIEDAFKQTNKSLPHHAKAHSSKPLSFDSKMTKDSSRHSDFGDESKRKTTSSTSSKLSVKRKNFESQTPSTSSNNSASFTPCRSNSERAYFEPTFSPEFGKNHKSKSLADEALNDDVIMTLCDDEDPLPQRADQLPPYKCLCQVQDLETLKQGCKIFLVKACVITLLSKLLSNIDTGWSLKARIFDGTGQLDVQFSDAVLTKLIGYTCKQAKDAKRQGDLLLSSDVSKGTAKCRDSIIEMCKIMEIEIDSETACAVVRCLHDADQRYWDSLDSV